MVNVYYVACCYRISSPKSSNFFWNGVNVAKKKHFFTLFFCSMRLIIKICPIYLHKCHSKVFYYVDKICSLYFIRKGKEKKWTKKIKKMAFIGAKNKINNALFLAYSGL